MERIDDLQCKGYRIVQDTEAFCYGIDAVLLSAFAKESVKKGSRVLALSHYSSRQRRRRRKSAVWKFRKKR